MTEYFCTTATMTLSKTGSLPARKQSILVVERDAITKAFQQIEKLLKNKKRSVDQPIDNNNVISNNYRFKSDITRNIDANLANKFRRKEEHLLLKCLAINALELSAPASDVLLRQRSTSHHPPLPPSRTAAARQSNHQQQLPLPPPPQQQQQQQQSWFQLSGHPDCFAPAGRGTIWKKCGDGTEAVVYQSLSQESTLHDIVPQYVREVEFGGEIFIELQDLLQNFNDPNVMDIKMGTRTFLESEVQNTFAREDLYRKMIAVDPNAPTPEEKDVQKVTKLRYMQFREQQSSTSTLGFRIEAMKFRGSKPVTDLKRVKNMEEVSDTLSLFLANRDDVKHGLLSRLMEFRTKLEQSAYFKTHEVVGSSILIIYDDNKIGAWLIDFAKTRPVPANISLTHRLPWCPGNHEEGFLYGLDQLIKIVELITFPQTSKAADQSTSSPIEILTS